MILIKTGTIRWHFGAFFLVEYTSKISGVFTDGFSVAVTNGTVPFGIRYTVPRLCGTNCAVPRYLGYHLVTVSVPMKKLGQQVDTCTYGFLSG